MTLVVVGGAVSVLQFARAAGTYTALAAGALVTVVTTTVWLDQAAAPLGRTALLSAAAIAVVGLLVVALGARATLREPLGGQVVARRRPRRATTTAVFLGLLVIVGAVVATYRGRRPGSEADFVVLLGPALVGLALGQVATWLVRLTARGSTRLNRDGGLGAFLASRRLARADDLVAPVRLVVAAGVVGALALTGSASVERWSDGQARIEAAGPRVLAAPAGELGGFGAWQLTHTLDPGGTHLMAITVVPNEERLAERRGYVDAARWDAVAGDLYADRSLAAAADVDLLARAPALPAVATGDRLRVAGTALVKDDVLQDEGGISVGLVGVVVGIDYVTRDNGRSSVAVELRLQREGSQDAGSVLLPGCRQGCLFTAMTLARWVPEGGVVSPRRSDFEVLFDRIELGDLDLLEQTWRPDMNALEGTRTSAPIGWEPFLVNLPHGLLVRPLIDIALPLHTTAADAPLPVLVAWEKAQGVLDLGGGDRRSEVVGEAALLPLVGSVGALADLPSASAGSGPTVPRSEVRIVAAEDTPAALLDQVADATGSGCRGVCADRATGAGRRGGPAPA